MAQPFCGSQTQSFIKLLFLKGPTEPPHLPSEKCSREKSPTARSIHWSLCSSRPQLCCPGFRLRPCLFSVGTVRRGQSKLLLAPVHMLLHWLLTQKRAHMEGAVSLPRALQLRRTEVLEGPLGLLQAAAATAVSWLRHQSGQRFAEQEEKGSVWCQRLFLPLSFHFQL